ncbi:alpha/beta fold hydrolase [Amycolatopsis rhabdoformis]|uniref:Alpha/beta fold hydrolase n=1 Tax=Amycolatopsis rhabdoformis TaxID=1448059 RepID=A0ABZ1I6T2_9PSEU|nr:alpha/beta fold hydrolase [Amycolatopsis rhabdoformis]WSE30136.1 alpha/beta fold hydrolase [Amycolatopsis rhabdoformis]
MPKFRLLVPVVAAVAMVPLVPALASAQGLDWKPCVSIAKGWDADDQRTECALVTVPLDYADPAGRTIDIAVSRIRATGERTGAIVFNPGGPGQSGMKTPLTIAGSKAAGLLDHHDLIGFDPRGVDYSASLQCDEDDAQPDPSSSEKDQARFLAEHKAAANAACFAKDPALVKSFTTPNIARDVDRVREALGEQKIGFYGVSWGTALGAEYRTLFDSHVDKMLLDSVMSPELNLKTMDDDQAASGENTFREFAAWVARYDSVYHFGGTEPQVEKALLALRAELTAHSRTGPDGSPLNGDAVGQLLAYPRPQWTEAAGQLVAIRDGATPAAPAAQPATTASPKTGFGWDTERTGGNSFQQNALLCNESPSPRDFDAVWQDRLDRIKANPVTGSFGFYEPMCVGWPQPATQWHFSAGKSPLQLVGHAFEPVTPIGWALAMQRHIGGSLMTIEDDAHGSLSSLPCAAAAVTFFDTGQTSTQSCPGDPVPAPKA